MGNLAKQADSVAAQTTVDQRKYLYLVGIHVTHSIAVPMHNFIGNNLGLHWQFINQECPTVEDAVALFRLPTFAGAVVTMPYKKAIMQYIDELDPLATLLGACNNVYLTEKGKLRGTNTDWRGIKGSLLSGTPGGKNEGKGKPALIIGAGGASRAAVYALFSELQCGEIYVVNRDAKEVDDLLKDTKAYVTTSKLPQPQLRHVTSVEIARDLLAPYYVVGSVPDFEAKTEDELVVKSIIDTFLQRDEKGVLLDMCYKPRNTRILKAARQQGWSTVDGTNVIAYQAEEQWRLWTGLGLDSTVIETSWKILRQAADDSVEIN